MYENRAYTSGQVNETSLPMPKYMNENLADFGKCLAQLRKAAGYTQEELAEEIGATRRVIAYYETESEHPPANLLVDLAQALKVSTDELLGVKPVKKIKQPDSRLLRRMQQIEKLDAATKRQVIQVIDTFIENAKLKKQA
ncbi:helix-turn-helix domain-containing protein [Microbulbifer sp. SSSA007]|uniref:helix-turn-helix domain-containing protein n=1 Tax=Microbulbifer sp. SSSA007 TaxID=3243379 RepID=UPI00403A5BD9